MRYTWFPIVWLVMGGLIWSCSDNGGENEGGNDTGSAGDSDGDTDSDSDGDSDTDTDGDTDGDSDTDPYADTGTSQSAQKYPELWYSAGQYLVHIGLSESDGTVESLTPNPIDGLPIGQNCLTMLDDGSLVGARLGHSDKLTYFYHIKDPPRDGSPVVYENLGVMPDEIMLEGLYTDCDGRLYGMDTGKDVGSFDGNRLLRFLGNYLKGDFRYEVVSDLSSAVVADIDDMGPGIDENGDVTDNPGLAIDTSNIYDFDYVTGTGTQVAKGGTWGIHVLGGPLFSDGVSRIFLLTSGATLHELDPTTYVVSGVLTTGPQDTEGNFVGWSGLAGPLTDCETGFPPVL